MKRLISVLLILVILFNFIWITPVYGSEGSTESGQTGAPKVGVTPGNMTNQQLQEAADGANMDTTQFNYKNAVASVLMGMMSMIINVIPMTFELIMTAYTTEIDVFGVMSQAAQSALNPGQTSNDVSFSVYRTVFNQIGVFDINYFNFDDSYESGSMTVQVPESIRAIKTNIAKWFYILRLVSAAIALLVLIYVGIRMAISTVASERATYKKMLVSWIESMIILFLLQYIILAIFTLGSVMEGFAISLKDSLEGSQGEIIFEKKILDTMADRFYMSVSNNIINNTVIVWVMFLVHARFFLLYIKRFFMTGFLILIAPLITITYPIDKMGDNRAQAFDKWFKELIISVFIMPIHASIYLVLGFTGGKIMEFAPLLALALLALTSQAESIIRQIFTMRGGVVVSELGKEGPGGKKKK